MPLKGDAFMIIWHDIRAESEPEYNRWHTREHMPERLGVPGFLRGRRGVDWNLAKHRYLTLYEGRDLAVFGSAPYLERLNNPTPWSNRVQPAFCNFIRSACATIASAGRGVGGALATIRLPFAGGGEAKLRADAGELSAGIMALDGVSAVHVAAARPEVTSAKTRETALRGTTQDAVFDAVVVVDGVGRREVEAAMPQVAAILAARGWRAPAGEAAVYDMAFMLEPD